MRAQSNFIENVPLALILITGCVSPDPVPTFLPAYEPFSPKDEDWAVTRPVLTAKPVKRPKRKQRTCANEE